MSHPFTPVMKVILARGIAFEFSELSIDRLPILANQILSIPNNSKTTNMLIGSYGWASRCVLNPKNQPWVLKELILALGVGDQKGLRKVEQPWINL